MKCLPAAKVSSAAGLVLHDWHAETLAIRAFNYFLLQECLKMSECHQFASAIVRRQEESELPEKNHVQPFVLRENLKIFMYCSEAPCGDASMELVMETQDDATPWPVVEQSNPEQVPVLKGRANFSELGVVRRKPCMPF